LPILYLPKYSYFGDYQILYNLRSNLVFKTVKNNIYDEKINASLEMIPDIIFMCISNEDLSDLCELFPNTTENIKKKSL
jgi:hypothetical protein